MTDAWARPTYPGDPVRMHMLIRNDPRFGTEIGDIRIQHYGHRANAEPDPADYVNVACFLPGIEECPPGDTPKVWPEFKTKLPATNIAEANGIFDEYLKEAREAGWKDYNPNG